MKLFLTAVVPLLLLAPAAVSAATDPGASAPRTCSSMSVAAPPGARVESVTAVRQPGGTVTLPAQPNPSAPVTGVPPYCDVTVTLTHPGAGDHVRVKVWLPESGWTGRLQAIGGSGYAAGDFGGPLAIAVKNGYAATSTDAGRPLSFVDTSTFVKGGQVDQALLRDFSSRSPHDLAIVGKEVTGTYYGRTAAHAYWNGCSTGGRQGYMEAQRHPGDFDGVLADAPAVDWARFAVATLYPQVVMNARHTYPTACEFDAFNEAAVKACDALDGVTDGIIGRPDDCGYDPRRLIGKTIVCDGERVTISAADADVVRRIWAGPPAPARWSGLSRGASFNGLAATTTTPDGTRAGAPFIIADNWVKTFLRPGFDTSAITFRQFAELFRQSVDQYDEIIGTEDPDLSAFRQAGGKMITWQGYADNLIPPRNTIDYRRQVDRTMGGTERVDDFYRLFLAPGVAHCGGGTGPVPIDPLSALVNWVEHGKAPDTLPAGTDGTTVTHDLCRYPQVSRYAGHGDPGQAASYRCTAA